VTLGQIKFRFLASISIASPALPLLPPLSLFIAALAIWGLAVLPAGAQEKPAMQLEQDCQTFTIASDNKIACSVPHLKRIKKVIVQRDDIWVAEENGKAREIVEGEKFMPPPKPGNYIVDSLSWSPDASRLVANITTQPPQLDEESDEALPSSSIKALALLEADGREIKIPNAKTRFVENATNGTWLADNVTIVYLIGTGPYQIGRILTSTGDAKSLFEGQTFDAVTWDARNNQAFAIGRGLSITGRQELFALDLMHETVRPIVQVANYQGQLTVSPSGKKIGYFADGDTIEVRDLATPAKPVVVHAGYGRFEWDKSERRVLLKRGDEAKSNDLVWVGIYDGNFTPILHDLVFHAFHISPDGNSVAVTAPGKNVLRVYPLE
jgi:hypothetical protein